MALCLRNNNDFFHYRFIWVEVPSACKTNDSLKVYLYERGFKNVTIQYQTHNRFDLFFETERQISEVRKIVFPNEKVWYFSEREGLTIK